MMQTKYEQLEVYFKSSLLI